MKKITLLFALLCASVMGWATQYCAFATGHLKDANFSDASGRILLTLQKNGNNVIVKIKNNNDNGNPQTGLNFLWVNATGATNNNATYGSHSAANAEEISVTVEFSAPQDSYTFNNIHWAYAGWGGEWAIDGLTVSASELCEGVSCTDETDPTVSAVSVGSITYNTATLTITASDNEGGSGIAQYIVKNGDTQIASSASNVITLTGLASNTTYNNIKVFAKDGCNNESFAFDVASFQTANLIYNQFPTGHLSDPNFGDIYGRILLTIMKVDDTTIAVKVEPNNNGTKGIKYLNIVVNGVDHIYGNNDGSGDDLTGFFEIGGLASLNFTFNLWFYCNSPNWTTNQFSVTESQLYSEAPSDTEKPSMADATVTKVSQTHNSVVISITGATDNVAVTKYVVKNHSDNSVVGEYTPAENQISVTDLSPETGYNWDIYAKDAAGNVSDNCKNITFTTDALVSNYCGQTLTNGDHSIALTCELVSGTYRIIIEGSNLVGIGGTYYKPGDVALNTKITSSSSTRIVCELDAEPTFYTPLYVNMPGEVSFSWPNDVVWGTCPDVDVTGVTLNHDALNMQVGGATQTLVATIAPANASNQNVTWESDDTDVATVDNGVVTAVGAGTAHITVTTQDGSYSASCEVSVSVPSLTPVTYNGYCTDGNFFVKYAITRTINRELGISANIEWLPTYGGVVAQIWRGADHINLTQSGSTFTGTFLSDLTDGEEQNLYFRFEYAGGAKRLENIAYTVGSEQAVPASIPVGAVVLNKASNTLSVGETDNLTATVYPSFATSAGSITWASDVTAYATVEAGTVTALAAGSANITASCGGVTSAPCVVTVAQSLEEAKYYGAGTFTDYSDAKNAFAYEYTFTRATNHEVTLDVVFSEDMTGIIDNANFRIFINTTNQGMTYNEATKTASYDFGSQSDGAEINYYFYFIMAGGVHQPLAATYTVGSSNEKVYACVVDEDTDNTAVLDAYNGRTAQVIVDRSFAAGNLYTLVLPFDANAAQTAEKLPGQLTKLNNTYVKENGDLRINFVDAEVIEAGVPYLYTPSEDVTNPVFEDVTVEKDLNPTEPADGYAKYYGIYAPLDGDAIHALTNSYVLGSDQYLYSVENLPATQTMKALRGYFVLNFPDAAPGAPKHLAKVVFNSNETETATAIDDVQAREQYTKIIENGMLYIVRDGKMYNAQGQLVK